MSVGISWASHNTLIYTSELILCSTIRVHSAMRQNIHMYPHLNSGVRLLLELYGVVVIKHVAFFTIWVKFWMPFNVPVYLWTFTPLFSEVVVVSDLNKNFVGSTNLAKKAQIGGLAYSYSRPSRRRSALRIRWRLRQWLWWFCSGGRWCHSWYAERGTREVDGKWQQLGRFCFGRNFSKCNGM